MAKLIGIIVVYGMAVIGMYATVRWHHAQYQRKTTTT